MVVGKITIRDDAGIHLRPAGIIAEQGLKYKCKITLCHDGRCVDGKSMLSILSLGIKQGYEIEVRCDGADEKDALEGILKSIESADQI